MSNTRRHKKGAGGRERHISVRAVRRNPPDLRRLSRALTQLAIAKAEAEAQRQPAGDRTSEGRDDTEAEARHD